MLAAKQLISSTVMFLFLLTGYTYAGTIIVNSTADTDARDDVVTLREAILLSEGTLSSDLLTPDEQTQVSTPVGSGEGDTIEFGISGTISISPSLPEITDSGTAIDASSQWSGVWPGGEPGVTLQGNWSSAGFAISGAENCHIRGLFITEFIKGILIYYGASSNTVGGSGVGNRNVISGNGEEGVRIRIDDEIRSTDNNVVSGNYIGTDVTGTAALGNMEGITLEGQSNIIGGATAEERNIISGNDNGVIIVGERTHQNVISGNYIGTDVTGTVNLGNSSRGINIHGGSSWNTIGGTTAEERNIISGNDDVGIHIYDSGNNVIKGNYIGTDVTGTADLGNSSIGIVIGGGAGSNTVGGATSGSGNIISGNDGYGVWIGSGPGTDDNTIMGNFIGTDVTGTMALGNDSVGVIIGGGARSNTIGGTTPGSRNIISGNAHAGVHISQPGTDNNVVIGNFIGTDVTGKMGLGDFWNGIRIEDGAQSNIIGSAGSGNSIAFNGGSGISIGVDGTDFNKISGNSIHHNGANGVKISSGPQSNIVGGIGEGNTIALNGENGILVEGGSSDFNRISANSIYDNNELGIELKWGGNDEIEPPNVALVSLADDILTVSGDGAGADAVVEMFIADSSGQEGQTYLGSLTAYGSGEFLDSLDVTGKGLSVGDRIVATTTHTDGNTSEFGSPHTVSKRQGFEGVEPILNPANGHYYEVVTEYLNWDDAKAAAESRTFMGLQGHLATITSQDENDFLLSIRPPHDFNLWLGGFQPPGSPEPDGNWRWITGEPFAYENWATNEPSNSYGDDPNEDKLEFQQDGKWNDMVGIWKLTPGYIVEYEPEARMLSITSAEASPGDQVLVQLSIDDITGVASGDIIIKYDASVITVDGVTPTELLSDILLVPNIEVPGEIGIFMAGTTGIPSGSGPLVEIALTVNPDAESGTETVLSFGEVRIYDEQGMVIPVNLEDGVVKITWPGIKGDVNEDGEVRSNDAMMALRIAAGLMIPTEYQQWAADMNDDGKVRANDATSILRKAAGLAAPGRGIIANAGGRITVTLSEAHGVAGERVTVPIEVDNVDMLASGEICIAYDSAVLRAVDVSCAPDVLLASNTTERGMLRIAFASANRLNSQTVAEIQFDVLADAVSTLRFRAVELYGPDANPVNSTGVDKEFRPWAAHPKHNALLQNFPNPFNPETWIPYQLAEDSEVTVSIYSTTGQLIRAMHLGYREAGSYVTRDKAAYWDGKNEAGEEVASGIYFCNIKAGEYTATRKMIARR